MERFYDTSVVNEKVLQDILDNGMSMKYNGKYKFKCGICNTPFYKKINLQRHTILTHLPAKGPYKCCECVYETQYISELHEHWRKHRVYKCRLCPNSFVTVTQMIRHLQQTHKHIYQCLECRKEFYTYRDIFLHYKEAHNQRTCDHCGKAFRRKKLLEQHMIYQHLPRKCDHCGEICKSAHGLGVHKRICRPEKHFKVIVPELSYCVECDKQYDSIEKYQNHLRSAVLHNPPEPVKVPCPECGKIFSRKLYMNNHYKLFHMKKSKHYCEICNKYFISAFSLRNHRKGVHEKKYPPKDKICDVCGRGFRANRILIHHKRTHTGEKPHQCAYCPSAFAQITAKKTHERTQHNVI
ncbi:PREDICTED: zinc finger protein 254-like [Papilio polytes]|uniref:zinc finger protein 254-like n=1 Tax=Papilio polytes TaxID=76194 RepID=UPI0006765EA0|nr:PREDICTED: zinc finger protein 254-like [Papilio polytes]